MKLKYKSALLIVFTGLFVITLGLFAFNHINTMAVTEHRILENEKNVVFISETVEKDILELIRITKVLASTNIVKESLNLSNTEFAFLTVSERASVIDGLNTTWINTDNINDPFVKSRMENDVASFLVLQQEEYPHLFGEIFLTNYYGVMVSTTEKLTTLAHYEKYWWQGAYNEGNGIVYLDDRGYDESVDGYVLGIVVPVYDDESNIIGMLKSNINIESIFKNSVEKFHDLSEEGNYLVVRTFGDVIYGNDIEPFSESVSENLLPYLEQLNGISKKIIIDGTEKFIAIAPINIEYKSNIIEFGGSYESSDHSEGNLGEDWSIIYIIDGDLALSETIDTLIYIGFTSIGLLFIVGVISLIIGHALSKPFEKLNNYIVDVGHGNLIKKDINISGYEIGKLKQSFDVMIDNLNLTLISKEKLVSSEENLKIAQRIGKIGSWELMLNNNKVWASEEAFNIYGLERKTEYIDLDVVQKMIFLDDADELREPLKNLIMHGKSYDVTFRLNSLDGKTKYVNSKASLVKTKKDNEQKIVGIIQDITEVRNKELELEYSANNDFLTGIYNRRYYEDNLIKLDIEKNYPLTIVMADINGLKLINDAFGHKSGDDLLISAANIMRDSCRENDLLARIGGDEFVMVLPNTNESQTEKIIKDIKKKAEKVIIESIPLSVSFGYKSKHNLKDDIQEAFRGAEDSMYRQKLIEIPSMRSGAIETILTTLYEKDKYSEIHSRSVSLISERLAKSCGLNRQDVAEVKTAGLLHDIGKIIIPEIILKKEGKLTTEEYELMKTHSEIGFRILNSTSDMRGISNIVLNHHERWDGKGYPRGIKSDKIPYKSRIISIADAFDAMTSLRTYQETISVDKALKEIIDNAGTQFDPELVEVFKLHFDEIIIDL